MVKQIMITVQCSFKYAERMKGVFEKGEYIVYGTTGVCQVMDITTMKQKEATQAKLYYVLEPVSSPGGKILTPVEENKNPMRRIVTREEADRLIEEIRNVKDLQIGDEKQREAKYKEALKSCDCKAWIGIIKTLYRRKKDRMVRGKRLTEVDERYFRKAKDNLYRELAIPLGITAEEVEGYIISRIDPEIGRNQPEYGMKKKKSYYVRIRAYKVDGKQLHYSAWSNIKILKQQK